jgi:hypothetical protein
MAASWDPGPWPATPPTAPAPPPALPWWASTSSCPALALRAGSDLRASGADHEDGEPERDSGGLIGFVLVEAVGEVWTDWLVSLGLRVPVLDALRGYHDEGFIATLGLVVDWGW